MRYLRFGEARYVVQANNSGKAVALSNFKEKTLGKWHAGKRDRKVISRVMPAHFLGGRRARSPSISQVPVFSCAI